MNATDTDGFLNRYWILLGGLLIALGYAPMLQAPFDFTDDGNLVYSAPGGSNYLARWWDRVTANVEHLGPFRPVLWAHWELAANTLQDDARLWRGAKLLWCAWAVGMALWLLKELRISAIPALLATAAAFWNPYRNEIWTSLTLAEGFAMPYALLALVAARKATTAQRPWLWDGLTLLGWFCTLGCKNTFVALLPAMVVLRVLGEGQTLRSGLVTARLALPLYALPLLMPVAHFIYFKMNWHAGQYETPGPSLAQLGRIFSWLKGAAGLDFLGVAVVGLLFAVCRHRFETVRESWSNHRAAWCSGLVVAASGVLVYLPMGMMAPRYTMPAIWGIDILFAALLAASLPRLSGWSGRLTWIALGAGILAVLLVNIGRQERLMARHRLIWDALHHVEQNAPRDTKIEWISGETSPTAFNIEEGIHFAWHLHHRGRGDVQVGLRDQNDQPLNRVEIPGFNGPGDWRLTMTPGESLLPWRAEQIFARSYRFGKQQYVCQALARVSSTPGSNFDAWTMQLMQQTFEKGDAQLLERLTEKNRPKPPLLAEGASAPPKAR